MTARRIGTGTLAVLLVAGAVLVAAVTQAIGEHSWGPLAAVGWIPAVLAAGLYRPRTRCRRDPRPGG